MNLLEAENEYLHEDFSDLIPFDWKETAKEIVDAVLLYEACPYEAEVNLLLLDDEKMREINRSERQIDRTTDVLSFPAVQYDPPSDFSCIEEMQADSINPDTGKLMLGDILISVPKTEAQAKEYGHSVIREFAFLIAHSMLHLLGYDHMTPEEERVMFQKQEAILKQAGYTREGS